MIPTLVPPAAPPDRMHVVVLEIALLCIESAISLVGGHDPLSKIARDLDDVIGAEKAWLEGGDG